MKSDADVKDNHIHKMRKLTSTRKMYRKVKNKERNVIKKKKFFFERVFESL
jgi:hypothetical protein